MFTTRVCPSQKSPKNENGWGKGEKNFPLEGIHGVLLHPINSGFVYLNMTVTIFYCNLSSYGEIIEDKCPIS
jgi:hypothetical protein